MKWEQFFSSLSILWHHPSLGLEWKLTFSSPVATAATFSQFAGILSAAHHLLRFEIAQLEFHCLHKLCLYWCFLRPTWFSVQFSSVTQSCPILCDPMNCSTPGLPVHHQLLGFTQTHVHWVGDAIQPSHPLSSPSTSCLQPFPASGSFQMSSSSHQVAKVLEFQL